MNICLITCELPGFGPSGGIGTAFMELAFALSSAGHSVDILLAAEASASGLPPAAFSKAGIEVFVLEPEKFSFVPDSPLGRSFAIYKTLSASPKVYDVIHFHDYLGLGFYTIKSKKLTKKFKNTVINVQAHGPLRWALESNFSHLRSKDDVLVDFMERSSLEEADSVVSPSQYLLDWMKEKGMVLREACVIPNLAGLVQKSKASMRSKRVICKEILMFGRHEFRKGLTTFCDALDVIAEDLVELGVKVTFLGQPSTINATLSELYLTERAKKWRFEIDLLMQLSREEAAEYIGGAQNIVAVVPSSQENSPYTVLENLIQGVPVVTSSRGGAHELFPEELHATMLFDGTGEDLAVKLKAAITVGLEPGRLATPNAQVERLWLEFHRNFEEAAKKRTEMGGEPGSLPSVVLGITHYERPEKLLQAVYSGLSQTYTKTQVVVLDDGSTSEAAIKTLEMVERLITPFGGRVIRKKKNGYLGAARNTIVKETVSDYLIFLDDDDIALPTMVHDLVTAAEKAPGSIVAPLNVFMEERRRGEALVNPEKFAQKVSHFITGGPVSSIPFGNYISSATAVFPRAVFNKLGGYSELKGVGFEDFELYARALQLGCTVEVLPEALYLYEVDRPSMISSTPAMANLSRVLNAIDLSIDPASWKDALACVAVDASMQAVEGRTHWLERISPYRDYMSSIRATGTNTTERFVALEAYAEAIGAKSIAIAWRHAADGQVGKIRPVPMSRDLAVIDESKLSIGGDEFDILVSQVEPYVSAYFDLAVGFENDEDVRINWIRGQFVTLNVEDTGRSRWLTLELGLDRDEVLSKSVIDVYFEFSSDISLGRAFLRARGGDSQEDVYAEVVQEDGAGSIRYRVACPSNWAHSKNLGVRFIVSLPLESFDLTIKQVGCSAITRRLNHDVL
jgi:glycosyltransferase involved in cell wall biosynthesis